MVYLVYMNVNVCLTLNGRYVTDEQHAQHICGVGFVYTAAGARQGVSGQ